MALPRSYNLLRLAPSLEHHSSSGQNRITVYEAGSTTSVPTIPASAWPATVQRTT
jgi:hypothetical protein